MSEDTNLVWKRTSYGGFFARFLSYKVFKSKKFISGKLNFHKAEQNWRNETNKNESICTQRPIMTSRNFQQIEMHVFEAPKI